MNTKRNTFTIFLALAFAALAAGAALASASSSASLVIRHQLRGCHSWSVNGGAFKASQSIALARGGSVTVTDNDMMPHKLIQTGGPAVRLTNLTTAFTGLGKRGPSAPGAMNHMGAATKMFFPKAGVYRFTTKAGEDYMEMKTVGPDNVLRLTVTVA